MRRRIDHETKHQPLLGELVRGYFRWMSQERNVSPHTIASYRDTFVLFIRHLSDTTRKSPDVLTFDEGMGDHVLQFLQHLERDRKVSTATRNHRLSSLKSFCRYVSYEKPLLADCCRRVTFIPLKKRAIPLLDYLEEDEMEAILDSVDKSTAEGRRNHTILLLLYNTGCRVGELANLTRDDCRLDHPRHVRILGKGRRWRTVPLWERTGVAIERTLKDRDDDSPHLFLGQRGNPITRFGVRHLLGKHYLLTAEKMPSLKRKKVTPHTVRHTTAVAMLRASGDIDGVAKILGHASLNTTKLYTAKDNSRLAETLNKVASAFIPAGEDNWHPDADLLTWLEKL